VKNTRAAVCNSFKTLKTEIKIDISVQKLCALGIFVNVDFLPFPLETTVINLVRAKDVINVMRRKDKTDKKNNSNKYKLLYG
jgi:hypothetical protein